eukprot:TRINITY_DN7513_c0_g1_i1.p1 TRINITY_DN7513_c0_g1~~TRINITY_DN7513_c0_g1_i1.p1  ORF type:complete len:108 (+),score=13.20 TRINITY_DN7513_c0_g1_i1:87-410(+)
MWTKWFIQVCSVTIQTNNSSSHNILVVGDGNFSFSLCLAGTLLSGNKLYCTSYDSRKELLLKYPECENTLQRLNELGCHVQHSVDATQLRETLLVELPEGALLDVGF